MWIGTGSTFRHSGKLPLQCFARTSHGIGIHAVSQYLAEPTQRAGRNADVHADAQVRLRFGSR
ncbi:hypothetical protein KR98_20150 [Ralstonia solanacearum]|nr:hypothetical protein KR98_20150 [Ralstonia solanacearum]KFX78629.1 hypothetical protein KR99_26055 [Ralstonia solanacearum]OCQ67519.1 hypothetical protein AR465_06490 [Ralstonia solanacearum]